MKPGVLPDEGDQMRNAEKRVVRIGIGKLDNPMTIAQAKRYGEANIPGDLKVSGFETSIGVSDPELHGGLWFRINYVKTMKSH